MYTKEDRAEDLDVEIKSVEQELQSLWNSYINYGCKRNLTEQEQFYQEIRYIKINNLKQMLAELRAMK